MGEITIEPKIIEKVTKETVVVEHVFVPDEQPAVTPVPATTPAEVPAEVAAE